MKQYLDLVKKVLNDGVWTKNRTKTKTLSTFGGQIEIDLAKGFPLLTTKKVFFHAVVVELLWFIKGDTNIRFLLDHDVHIWDEWPYEAYLKKNLPFLTQKAFIEKIKNDDEFAKIHGELGPVYGKQWRNYNGIDQLKKVLDLIKNKQDSRRMILCAWNPSEVDDMLLPPCHCLFQFSVKDNKLSCHLYQRSADLFLGVPFNIASYALLTFLIAKISNLAVGKFIHSFGDLHIYEDHIEQCKIQLTRSPFDLCQLKLNPNIKSLEDFQIADIEVIGYKHHPKLVGKVAI